MEFIKYIIEYDGTVTVNNEYTVEIQKNRPWLIRWFKDQNLTVSPAPQKIIKIDSETFIIRPHKAEPENVEIIAGGKSYFFNKTNTEIKRGRTETIAVENLNTVLGHVRITKFQNNSFAEQYIAADSKRNPNAAEKEDGTAAETGPSATELPFAFLQCVAVGDYENARKMLSFDITDENLRSYFIKDGNVPALPSGGSFAFEVLINNYLDNPDTVSILPAGSDTARTFRFRIENGKISNIE